MAEAHAVELRPVPGAARHPRPHDSRPRWSPNQARARLWRWWFAPLAATAAAATVWMVVPQDRFTAPPARTGDRVGGAGIRAGEERAAPPSPPATCRGNVASDGKPFQCGPRPRRRRRRLGLKPGKRNAKPSRLRRANAPAETAKPADTAARAESPKRRQRRRRRHPQQRRRRRRRPSPNWAKVLADERVTARSAPSPNVVWLVGRAGLVQLATDGQHLRAGAVSGSG